jgi:hypothetical protein
VLEDLVVGNNFAQHGEPLRECMIGTAQGTNSTAVM